MRTVVAAWLALGLAGCGGKAIVDGLGSGDGGAAGASGTTTTTPTTGSTTGTTLTTTATTTTVPPPDCTALGAEVQITTSDAQRCNACSAPDECNDGPKIHDACGCLVGACALSPDAVATANAAYDEWVAAGCGPDMCQEPCFSPDAIYYCTPTGGDCAGRCVAAWGP